MYHHVAFLDVASVKKSPPGVFICIFKIVEVPPLSKDIKVPAEIALFTSNVGVTPRVVTVIAATILIFDQQTSNYLGNFGDSEELNAPEGLSVRDGLLYVASYLNGEIVRYDIATSF